MHQRLLRHHCPDVWPITVGVDHWPLENVDIYRSLELHRTTLISTSYMDPALCGTWELISLVVKFISFIYIWQIPLIS